jgi:hypothetical protein
VKTDEVVYIVIKRYNNMSYERDEEEGNTKGKAILCEIAAHKIKNIIMKDIKETESDIASACAIFHKRHELKTGKPITTINEFEQVTRVFSKLSKEEMEKLIEEGKEEDKKNSEMLTTDKAI